jgi:hypothetical protein
MSIVSIASKLSLAVAFAAGLAATTAHAAVEGFSIALTDMAFERGADLAAEAAAFGGQPALGLPGNSTYKYKETLTGDYAVFDDLPPSDERDFWQTFTQISLNGVPFFTGRQIVGPESQDDIWSAILNLTGLTKPQLAVLKAVLVNHNLFGTGGTFDYAYNFAPDDRTTGTFAVGSNELGSDDDPLGAFESGSASDGPNIWSLTFSATVTTVPEPPTWLMLMAGGAGLLLVRGLARRPGGARQVRA